MSLVEGRSIELYAVTANYGRYYKHFIRLQNEKV